MEEFLLVILTNNFNGLLRATWLWLGSRMCCGLWILKMLSVPRARTREHILRTSPAPSALCSPNRSCQQRSCWTWHWLGHGFIQLGSFGLAAPVMEAVHTRKSHNYYHRPFSGSLLLQEEEKPRLHKVSKTCLGSYVICWYFGAGFGPVQGKQHENSNGTDRHIEVFRLKSLNRMFSWRWGHILFLFYLCHKPQGWSENTPTAGCG